MSWGFDDISCGGQLQVGTGIVPAIKQGDEKINGSMHCEGPMVVGGPTEFSDNLATLMVGRTKNDDKDCVPADHSLWVKGNSYIQGDGAFTGSTLHIQSDLATAININDVTTIDNEGDAIFAIGTDGQTMSSRFSAADGRPKPFDIKHPSYGDGWRLRYAAIEGPEVGVYCRGRVKREKVIILPKVWKDLVHIDSISVQLQPIGAHQDIIVKRWDAEKIEVQSKPGIPINCFYHVYAERKDINPLITEYEGESWKDYPDPNYNPEKVHYEDQTFTDPRFAGPPNTVTM